MSSPAHMLLCGPLSEAVGDTVGFLSILGLCCPLHFFPYIGWRGGIRVRDSWTERRWGWRVGAGSDTSKLKAVRESQKVGRCARFLWFLSHVTGCVTQQPPAQKHTQCPFKKETSFFSVALGHYDIFSLL